MDSPSFQSALRVNPSRLHHQPHTTLPSSSHVSVTRRGAVQKRNPDNRTRSISTTQADRLYQLAVEQQQQQQQQQHLSHQHQHHQHHQQQSSQPDPQQSIHSSVQWITPQSSPQLHDYSVAAPSLDTFSQWTVPTPPRSDSGIPSVAIDANEKSGTTGLSAPHDFSALEHPTASAEMSSLGFLLPTQYGSSPYETDPAAYPMDKQYMPPMQVSQPAASTGAPAYPQTTISSSQALYSNRGHDATASGRRHSEMQAPSTASHAYDQTYRRISSPYNGGYSVSPSQTIPSISGMTQSPLPSPHIGAPASAQGVPHYGANHSRNPSLYDTNVYQQQQPYSTAPPTGQMYASSHSYPSPYVGSSVNDAMSKSAGAESIRVINQRPKPQCWEHGCNGRQFSTFSNLLRHQREKSGTASKSYCPKCGAEFTRTTARNGHLAHDKCTKQRQPDDGK